jgi:hypothetical protein
MTRPQLGLRILKGLVEEFDQFHIHSFRSSEKRLLKMFSNEISSQLQLRVSSFLASKLFHLSFTMIIAILRLVLSTTTNPTENQVLEQRQMLLISIPWLLQVELNGLKQKERELLLMVLFRLTTNLNETCYYDQLKQLWFSFATSSFTTTSTSSTASCSLLSLM